MDFPNIPHKGWTIVDAIHIREEGQGEDETVYPNCIICNNDRIRYVHIVSLPDDVVILK